MLIVIGLFLVLPSRAAADHLFATTMDPPNLPTQTNRLGLLGPCIRGIPERDFPANTGFFVAHGWAYIPWEDATPVERLAFVSLASVFVLTIDGQVQTFVLHMALINTPDGQFMSKLFVSEYDRGYAGTHVFVGTWYYDASDPSIGGAFGQRVQIGDPCVLTVHFV